MEWQNFLGTTGRSETTSVQSFGAIGTEVLVQSGRTAAVVVVGSAEAIPCIAVVAADFEILSAGPAEDNPYTVAAKMHCQSQWAVVRVHRVAAADLAGSWNATVARMEIGLDEHYCRHRGKNWSLNTCSAQLPADRIA